MDKSGTGRTSYECFLQLISRLQIKLWRNMCEAHISVHIQAAKAGLRMQRGFGVSHWDDTTSTEGWEIRFTSRIS